MKLDSVVISVPAQALGGNAYFGSVFDAWRLKELTLPPELRLALDVVLEAHGAERPLKCVARPEMFTHGRSLEWLRVALPGVTEHLILSDGQTLKLIPGLANHAFVYGLQSVERRRAFRQLNTQAPELWPQLASQINSQHPGVVPAVALLRSAPPTPSMLWFYPLYLNRHSIQDSVDHVLGWGEPESVRLTEFESVTYLSLTECAIRDRGFQRVVAEAVVRAYFDPAACLVLGLPSPAADLSQRLTLALEGVNASAIRLPRARAARVFFVANDLPEASLAAVAARLTLILHPSVEFWGYTRALYAGAARIVIPLERGLVAPTALARRLYDDAFGRPLEFIRPMYPALDEI